jgi:hypothetical protein
MTFTRADIDRAEAVNIAVDAMDGCGDRVGAYRAAMARALGDAP